MRTGQDQVQWNQCRSKTSKPLQDQQQWIDKSRLQEARIDKQLHDAAAAPRRSTLVT